MLGASGCTVCYPHFISCFVLIDARKCALDTREGIRNKERSIKQQYIKKRVVAVVEASKTCQSSFDHDLGASRHHNREERRR
jgi:hypothetical protein